MTEQEQQIEIADFCGWKPIYKRIHPEMSNAGFMLDPKGNMRMPPNYLHDLNAMHEAEENAPAMKYYENLCVASCATILIGYRHLWHATAAQRAEALLRTIGKWKDA